VPALQVAGRIIHLDAGAGGGAARYPDLLWERITQRDQRGIGVGVRVGFRLRIWKRVLQIVAERIQQEPGIEDAISGPDDRLPAWPGSPREPDAWREIVVIRLYQVVGQACC